MTRLEESNWCKRLLTEPDQGWGTGTATEEVPHDGRANVVGAEPIPGSVSSRLSDPNWCKRR